MRLSAFRKLSPQDQHELVALKGVLLWQRKSKNFNIFLYQLGCFYVELFFFKESGEFATIKPFDNMDELSPYLAEIDVGHLLGYLTKAFLHSTVISSITNTSFSFHYRLWTLYY